MTDDAKLISLHCNSCAARLSQEVTPLVNVADMQAICDLGPKTYDRHTPVPPGYALFMEGDVLAAHQRQVPGWEPRNGAEIWMNLADIRLETIWSDIPGRLNGCCGPDGMNGPNRLCRCDAEIGTESSDCWTWQTFVPVPENTEWKTR